MSAVSSDGAKDIVKTGCFHNLQINSLRPNVWTLQTWTGVCFGGVVLQLLRHPAISIRCLPRKVVLISAVFFGGAKVTVKTGCSHNPPKSRRHPNVWIPQTWTGVCCGGKAP
jgi:hypothetical protein